MYYLYQNKRWLEFLSVPEIIALLEQYYSKTLIKTLKQLLPKLAVSSC